MTAEIRLSLDIHQCGGVAFVLGNALFMVNKLNDMSRLFLGRLMPDVISGQNPALIFLGQVTLIFGYLTYYRFYARGATRLSKNALRLFCGGGIVLALGHFGFMSVLTDVLPQIETLFLLVFLGLLSSLVGLIWFGMLNLRQPVLGRWSWLPLFTGLMGVLGFVVFRGTEITTIFLVFRTLFALGLIGLGTILWLEKPNRTRASSPQ
jgi:hypothetical protein